MSTILWIAIVAVCIAVGEIVAFIGLWSWHLHSERRQRPAPDDWIGQQTSSRP